MSDFADHMLTTKSEEGQAVVANHPIPLAALDDRLGFVGTAGSGKTYNAGSGVERVLSMGGRVVIPDPLGVWWGMALAADGKTPAPWRDKQRLVIFGGEHGDLPLNEHVGALIGETVAGMAESAILDLSGFGTKASEVRFMLAFLTALYRHASGEPVHLVFDEADMWAPQQERDKGEATKLLGMMETVVRRGRIKGFIPWLITQRPAVLNKNVLSQVDGLVAFKLTSSQDRDALGAWIEGQADRAQGREILGSLPTLPRGTGVVWLPGRGVLETAAFPAKATFDSSRTPTRGERVERRDLKPLNLENLKERLSGLEEEAKANDPRALKAEVARLARELAKVQRVKAAPAPPPERIIANADEIEAARAEGERLGYGNGLAAAVDAVTALAGSRCSASAARSRRPVAAPLVEQMSEAPIIPAEGLTGPQQRILNALAWWQAFGIDRPTNEQAGFIAGYSPGSGNFNNLKGGLRTLGLIDYPAPGRLCLTGSGDAKAEAPAIAVTRDAFHQAVRAKLKGPQLRLFDPVLAAYPDSLASDAVAEAAGYSAGSGNFNNLRGSLKTIGLVDYPRPGEIRASDWLFP